MRSSDVPECCSILKCRLAANIIWSSASYYSVGLNCAFCTHLPQFTTALRWQTRVAAEAWFAPVCWWKLFRDPSMCKHVVCVGHRHCTRTSNDITTSRQDSQLIYGDLKTCRGQECQRTCRPTFQNLVFHSTITCARWLEGMSQSHLLGSECGGSC